MAAAGPAVYWYFSLFYVLLITGFSREVWPLFALFIALVLSAAWGFLLNDLFDRYTDITAGRSPEERGHLLSVKILTVLVVGTAAVSWGIVFALGGNVIYRLILLTAYVLSVLYSTPPIKLKHRALSGLLADSLMERPLPILVIFTFAGYYGWETFLFPLLTELAWSVFKHQADDYESDVRANVRTLAVALGRDLTYKIVYNVLNPLSVASVVILALITWLKIPGIGWIFLPALGILIGGVIVSLVLYRKGLLRNYTTTTDPPYIMFLNMAYRVILLPSLAIAILTMRPAYYPFMILLAISLAPHLKYYRVLVPVIVRDLLKTTVNKRT